MKLLALFLSHLAVASLAVAAYIELSARRGVAAGPADVAASKLRRWMTEPRYSVNDLQRAYAQGQAAGPDYSDADPRTAELATGGGR